VKTSWNVYFPSQSNFCIAVCLMNHPNPYITKKLCCCYTPGPSPKSGVISAAPSVNEQTPLKLPKGWSYTKLAANVTFLHISHIVLTSATPHHFKKQMGNIYSGIFAMFDWDTTAVSITTKMVLSLQSYFSFTTKFLPYEMKLYTQDIANKYTSNTRITHSNFRRE